jgi:hypothetical protein
MHSEEFEQILQFDVQGSHVFIALLLKNPKGHFEAA